MHRSILLASASPRRRQLLRLIGLNHEVAPASVDESPIAEENAVSYVERMARLKAMDRSATAGGLPVLGADTAVVKDGLILGKPTNEDDARDMLAGL